MRIVKIILIIPVVYIFAMPAYLSLTTNRADCGGVVIRIRDSAEYRFTSKKEILNLVGAKGTRVTGEPIKSLPITEIESRLSEIRDLRFAEAFPTIDGYLYVEIDQRDPIMRVIPRSGGDFYIDDDGFVFRRKGLYSPRLQIIVGNINITADMLRGVSVLDTASKSMLRDVFHLVKFINNDSFWAAQVDQISIDSDREIDLIPRVGNQVVHLGQAENYEQKFANLEAFYKEVLPEVGWRKYETINLEFQDQIVCKIR